MSELGAKRSLDPNPITITRLLVDGLTELYHTVFCERYSTLDFRHFRRTLEVGQIPFTRSNFCNVRGTLKSWSERAQRGSTKLVADFPTPSPHANFAISGRR